MHNDTIQVLSLVGVVLVSLALALGSEAAECPTDFRGIHWGTPVRAVPDLQADAARREAIPDLTYYTRASDDRTVLGVEAEAIRYMAAHDQIIGVAIQFRNDRQGLAHCEQAVTRLREIYGAPHQHRDIFYLPAKSVPDTTAVAGPTRRFSQVSTWFARLDTEARVEITCPAQAESFPGGIQLRWTAAPRTRQDAPPQSAGPAGSYELSSAQPR